MPWHREGSSPAVSGPATSGAESASGSARDADALRMACVMASATSDKREWNRDFVTVASHAEKGMRGVFY